MKHNPDTGRITCAGCNEEAVVTFTQALDMLNEQHSLGHMSVQGRVELEDIGEIDE